MKNFYEIDEEFPADDPGNQLRAKLNGTISTSLAPECLDELLHTAAERGILSASVTAEDAMTIHRLIMVGIAIDRSPPGEIDRVRM